MHNIACNIIDHGHFALSLESDHKPVSVWRWPLFISDERTLLSLVFFLESEDLFVDLRRLSIFRRRLSISPLMVKREVN